MSITVVIPAHQEEDVIGACLSSLAAQDYAGPLQVVVVANGCCDHTSEIAARFPGVEVVEVNPRSKPFALNKGDAVARYGHRMYVDADVELAENAVSSVAAALDRGVRFCAPRIVTSAVSYPARAYGRVWGALPYVREEVIGAGVYAVHAEARKRWGRFPEIVADDKFARLHFTRTERRVIEDTQFTLFLPEGVFELVRVRGRWIRANRQLRGVAPNLVRQDSRRFGHLARFLAVQPRLWRDLPVFLAIYLAAEIYSWLPTSDPWPRATRARQWRASSFAR